MYISIPAIIVCVLYNAWRKDLVDNHKSTALPDAIGLICAVVWGALLLLSL